MTAQPNTERIPTWEETEAPLNDEFWCSICGTYQSGMQDERDELHRSFDGAHRPNWYRVSDDKPEFEIEREIIAEQRRLGLR